MSSTIPSCTGWTFLSTPSARRATHAGAESDSGQEHFYPRPPRGGRPLLCSGGFLLRHFYPRPPRGGRLSRTGMSQTSFAISIHALREEGDLLQSGRARRCCHFYPRPPRGGRLVFRVQAADERQISIHALREEGDGIAGSSPVRPRQFLSTPSARRATPRPAVGSDFLIFLSTPSARRATRPVGREHRGQRISIHALREEGDSERRCQAGNHQISIHALREEGDAKTVTHFPRIFGFLSTPSARRATRTPSNRATPRTISIHALREEGDALGFFLEFDWRYFYPRPPRGGRRLRPGWFRPVRYFYPRPPRGGRHRGDCVQLEAGIFLSTPSARRATAGGQLLCPATEFLSTPSARRATD